jgi:hypothetical protein
VGDGLATVADIAGVDKIGWGGGEDMCNRGLLQSVVSWVPDVSLSSGKGGDRAGGGSTSGSCRLASSLAISGRTCSETPVMSRSISRQGRMQ